MFQFNRLVGVSKISHTHTHTPISGDVCAATGHVPQQLGLAANLHLSLIVNVICFIASISFPAIAQAQFHPCDFTVNSANDLHGSASIVVDINGDGRKDLVTTRQQGPVSLLNFASGIFTPVFSTGTVVQATNHGVDCGDFDRDGKIDVARGSYENDNPNLAKVVVSFGNGDGSFSSEVVLPVGNWVTEVHVADLDGDGDADILCGTETTGIRVWKSNGNRTFSASSTYSSGSINRQSELCDLNGDNRLDVVIVNETENKISILLNNGSGQFPSRVTYATGSYPTGLCVGDFDGDGDVDIAFAHRYTNEIRLLRNNGQGTFIPWQTISSPMGSAPIGQLKSGDFDGDGDMDFVAVSGYGATQQLRYFINSGNGSFVGGAYIQGTASSWWIITNDFDVDGKTDILSTEYFSGNTMMYVRELLTGCNPSVLQVPSSSFPKIQSAIDFAQTGVTIQVAPGTYNEAIDFKGKAITVKATGARASTIIDGTGLTTSVVRAVTGETSATVLQGFTIRNGAVGSKPPWDTTLLLGGGLYIERANPIIRDCAFTTNHSAYGGGIYALYSNSLVENCTFTQNSASSYGGGIQFFGGSPIIRNCVITNNTCLNRGGGIHLVQWNGGASTLDGCTITGNSTNLGEGGGVSLDPQANAAQKMLVSNCTITNNTAHDKGGGLWATVNPANPMQNVMLNDNTICNNTSAISKRENVWALFEDGGNTICDCVSDISGDGDVDTGDLSYVLLFVGEPTDADFIQPDQDMNGFIDTADVSLVLLNMGACP